MRTLVLKTAIGKKMRLNRQMKSFSLSGAQSFVEKNFADLSAEEKAVVVG